MSARKPEPVTLLPVAPMLLELHSQRFCDLVHALGRAGFVISNTNRTNRFRIDDAKEKPRG